MPFASYTQEGRPISVTTPLATDALLLQAFSGVEAVSEPFRFRLDLLARKPVAFDKLLGQPVTVSLAQADGSVRPINGVVERLVQGVQLTGPEGPATFIAYHAEIVPRFALLKRNAQSRIFQQLSVPDILTQVLTGLSISNQTQGTYEKRDFCVQYHETDFDFACRLMEEEGIYYFFTHATGSHQMVLADTPQSHVALPGTSKLVYDATVGGAKQDDRIHTWWKSQQLRSGKFTAWDSCFELPGNNLAASQPTVESVQVGTVSHKLQVGGNSAFEIYEYPGGYAQRFDGVAPGGADQASTLQKIFKDNTRTVGIRMQQEAARGLVVEGTGNVRGMIAGYKFTLNGHFDGDGDYALTRVEHEVSLGDSYTHGSEAFQYENRFRCIPIALPFRPERLTPRPRIDGTQTAVVVGPQGQEIFTDKYSRVKVQFPWDRQGTNDANSSCWVRVASNWSGKQWGFIQIPRIGQEVVVSFEEGDPDRPIITGSVFNAEQMPPYTLPDNMTRSGTLSRSTTQGTAETFNQLYFEDKKDSELVYFHAEKDFQRVVENDDSLKVGYDKKNKGDQTIDVFNNQTVTVGGGAANCADGSQSVSIFNNQTLKVGSGGANAPDGSQTVTIQKDRSVTINTGNDTLDVKQGNRSVTVDTGNDSHVVKTGNRSVTVNTGNDTHEVKTGNRSVTVDTGNDTHEVKMGNRSVTIDLGNDTLTIKTGNQTTTLNIGSSTTEALQGITLKSGPSSIQITPEGVTIKGMTISVQGTIQTQVQGLICQVSADAMLQMKGGITMIN